MIRGITLAQVKRFDRRWTAIATGTAEVMAAVNHGIETVLANRSDKFEGLKAQAIADRQAAIRVMSQEISELNSL